MSATLARAQLEPIVHALAVVLPARSPADAALKRFFRDHRSLGSRDRALVADTVYSVLRRRRLLEALTPSAAPRELALASLVRLQGFGIGQLESLLKSSERNWLAALKARDLDDLPTGARRYLRRIEDLLGIPLFLVSVGPNRAETIVLKNPFR